MSLPTFLLRLIDPAGAYMQTARARGDEGRAPAHRGAVVFGPGIPGGSREATEPERIDLEENRAERLARYNEREHEIARLWGPQLHDAADELLAKDAVTIHFGERTVEAQVIRFWRGSSLLATTSCGPTGGGKSLSRISRDPRRAGPDVLLSYLIKAATKG